MTRANNDTTASADDRLQTTRLPLSEMHCNWRARRIADHLQRVDGVVETTVGPGSAAVVVRYDPTRTTEAALTAAVESPGPGAAREATPGPGAAREATPARSGRRSSGCQCRRRTRSW